MALKRLTEDMPAKTRQDRTQNELKVEKAASEEAEKAGSLKKCHTRVRHTLWCVE